MITSDQFRVLASQRETTTLDFKESFYENSAKGNGELAKDIIAMANLLDPDSTSAYVLIGVREESDGTGAIVGFAHETWMTDGNLQQKVRAQLNRAPQFSFGVLAVDGVTVAVLEISPGGRPFYGLRDSGNLKRNHAHIRVGSTTDLASPEQIVGWVERDGNLKYKRLEFEKLEADQALRGRLALAESSISSGVRRCKFEIYNDGTAAFAPLSVTCTWHVDEDAVFMWLSQQGVRLLRPVASYTDSSKPITSSAVRPGAPISWDVVYQQTDIMGHLENAMRGRLEGVVLDNDALRSFILSMSYCNVSVTCENIARTRQFVLQGQLGWDPSRWAFPSVS
jgi:hypothetical protein